MEMNADDRTANGVVEAALLEQGITPLVIRPETRLSQDLGVDGDDARDVLRRIEARSGTDFSALYAHWTDHFAAEGINWITGGAFLALTFACTIGLMMAGIAAVWAMPAAMIAGGAMTAGLDKLMPRRRREPVTIAQLADAIRQGRWSSPSIGHPLPR